MTDPIYLDHNATTPVAPEVFAALAPWLQSHFGNPSSSHVYGRRAAQAVAQARAQVAGLIGAQPSEIVLTGCATEANNLALLGLARAADSRMRHLVISSIEHPAVAAPAQALRDQGWEVTVVGVDEFGRVSAAEVEQALRPDTALVSVMHANNEVGTLQPIAEIAALTRPRGILLHTDAAQSVGKLAVNVDALGVDLLTIAGHKFGAPKGIGALYVRAGTPILHLLHGADQERGLRPGTENVALIVALGAACALAAAELPSLSERLRTLRDRLHQRLVAGAPALQLNGHREHRLPNTLHVSFPGVTGRALLADAADTVAASLGSACHSEQDAVSGVLAAMGIDAARASGAVRLSVGRTTSTDDVERAAAALVASWARLNGH
ncbi:cysteine desulfurase family protein [Piscinibacter sp.]|uniref:cysteine desulfurase family protein n=1 Tax=Piscinibacter sp. TaxID=1903157 RepID=UPI0035B3FC54